jgi:hypothetical protein
MSQQPIPVIPLEYAEPEHVVRPAFLRVTHVVALACCVVGWLLILAVSVETVIVTGPVLFAAGVALFVGGMIHHDRRSAVFGVSHMSICVLFVLLVNVLRWSPAQATLPFAIMGAAYTTVAVGVAALLHWHVTFAVSLRSRTMNRP